MIKITKELILKDFKLEDSDVLNIYPYGSRVYGTAHPYHSDYDFIIVVKDGIQDRDSLESTLHNLNATIYSESSFKEKIKQHTISVMECVSLPTPQLVKHSVTYPFDINLSTLRESISTKSSHSWVKAKKKFEVPQDRNVYIAKKSLFHSLRILDFGMQLAKEKRITDFHSCVNLWQEIISNPCEDWAPYKGIYQERFNNLSTEFRKLAPK